MKADMINKKLIQTAKDAMINAYAPYSNFKVGAALLCEDGSIYTGCNIENSSFSATVCAERTAFFKALSDGKRSFLKIAVVGGKDGITDDYTYPCGICRQVMSEFCDDRFEIILYKDDGEILIKTLKDLLPFSFLLQK